MTGRPKTELRRPINNEIIHIRISTRSKGELEKLAYADDMNVSEYTRRIIKAHIAKMAQPKKYTGDYGRVKGAKYVSGRRL